MIADWTREMREMNMISAPPLDNWLLFYTLCNVTESHTHLQTLHRVSGPLGIGLQRATMWGFFCCCFFVLLMTYNLAILIWILTHIWKYIWCRTNYVCIFIGLLVQFVFLWFYSHLVYNIGTAKCCGRLYLVSTPILSTSTDVQYRYFQLWHSVISLQSTWPQRGKEAEKAKVSHIVCYTDSFWWLLTVKVGCHLFWWE